MIGATSLASLRSRNSFPRSAWECRLRRSASSSIRPEAYPDRGSRLPHVGPKSIDPAKFPDRNPGPSRCSCGRPVATRCRDPGCPRSSPCTRRAPTDETNPARRDSSRESKNWTGVRRKKPFHSQHDRQVAQSLEPDSQEIDRRSANDAHLPAPTGFDETNLARHDEKSTKRTQPPHERLTSAPKNMSLPQTIEIDETNPAPPPALDL